MKTLLTVAALLLMASGAFAQGTYCYGWEDGGDAVGCYNCSTVDYHNSSVQAVEGTQSLSVREIDGTSTPQVYVAWVRGVTEGDVVTVSFDVYDDTVLSNPSLRLWGHYSLDDDIDAYDGSAGGNGTYSGAVGGWETLTWDFVIAAGKTNLVVECRPYDSVPYSMIECFVDNMCVTAPDGVTIHFPGGTVDNETDASWGEVKALFQ